MRFTVSESVFRILSQSQPTGLSSVQPRRAPCAARGFRQLEIRGTAIIPSQHEELVKLRLSFMPESSWWLQIRVERAMKPMGCGNDVRRPFQTDGSA